MVDCAGRSRGGRIPHVPTLALAHRVLREHGGGRVLVVAHSDTVNEIVEALSGSEGLAAMGEDQYDTMYVVSVPRIGRATVLRLTY